MAWFKKKISETTGGERKSSKEAFEAPQSAPPAIEQQKVPESQPEAALSAESTEKAAPAVAPQTMVQTPTAQADVKSPIAKEIENIMEEGLVDLYVTLDPAHQFEFKKRGEETANMIERLVISAKITVQKVFQLILSWLKIIPHVNKYYLEQEAKIKADKVLRALEEQKTVQVNRV